MGTVVELNARRESRLMSHAGIATPHSRPHTVRLHEPAERAYWCRHFHATAEQLCDVVKEVGANPAIVQLHLYGR
jgi:Protein of unknown function (DUF3606)